MVLDPLLPRSPPHIGSLPNTSNEFFPYLSRDELLVILSGILANLDSDVQEAARVPFLYSSANDFPLETNNFDLLDLTGLADVNDSPNELYPGQFAQEPVPGGSDSTPHVYLTDGPTPTIAVNLAGTGGNILPTCNPQYPYDAFATLGAPPGTTSTIYNQPNVLAGHQPSVPLFKKSSSFPCPHESCGSKFTTNYRLKTHINARHTAPELQVFHRCEKCPYKTLYKSDLPRHRKTCARSAKLCLSRAN
ncbi:hypothetical protein HYPSUDRAFT_567424 [Hypholoma sublateritium FD-334 SS-4]|uniref:C2H2-type domain-containing protein n=1 Tax=Hypholoma sublateritium (strain FD-334 SS-4) TaxID=945553 RepID=A0A0D2LRA1_HYPSF|nr:hypothetical protein HYPSUDRAFT_567424 [Hypholoma sublateritium FD-334 SS-4]